MSVTNQSAKTSCLFLAGLCAVGFSFSALFLPFHCTQALKAGIWCRRLGWKHYVLTNCWHTVELLTCILSWREITVVGIPLHLSTSDPALLSHNDTISHTLVCLLWQWTRWVWMAKRKISCGSSEAVPRGYRGPEGENWVQLGRWDLPWPWILSQIHNTFNLRYSWLLALKVAYHICIYRPQRQYKRRPLLQTPAPIINANLSLKVD